MISSVCTWLPAGRLSQETLITTSRTEATLNEVAGVQSGPPSSQNVNAALGTSGGASPPFADEEPMQPTDPTARSRIAANSNMFRRFHRVLGCCSINIADLIRTGKQTRKRAGR